MAHATALGEVVRALTLDLVERTARQLSLAPDRRWAAVLLPSTSPEQAAMVSLDLSASRISLGISP